MSCAEAAEPIDLPSGLWTRVCRRKHKFNHIRQVAPLCPHGRAHWHNLANTTEPSIGGSDAVLCQVTLTTVSICFPVAFQYIIIDWISFRWKIQDLLKLQKACGTKSTSAFSSKAFQHDSFSH